MNNERIEGYFLFFPYSIIDFTYQKKSIFTISMDNTAPDDFGWNR